MTEKQQIEKMAKVLYGHICEDAQCEECDYNNGSKILEPYCECYLYARRLYNAGYRERKEIAKEILQRFYNYLPPKEKDSFEIKTSSLEDVKKVVLQFHNSLNDDIREFAKQYGVDID